ncbi:thiamine phosphate synthase [Candidatus Saganbacteria bacterium]|nr:thiamine phosphate synthase [Candidatus Saganbacteria bacterium]
MDDFVLYPVTCEALSRGRSNIEVLTQLIEGGVKVVQLREKDLNKKEFFNLAVRFREITLRHGVKLIINDHLDVALAVKADGIHLGQSDLPCREARKLAPGMIIGVSTHNLEQARAAEKDGASYVNLGPIFDTTTKGNISKGLGVELIKEVAPHLKIPFTVMGGIGRDNIDEVLAAGARRIAMITALSQAEDIKETVRYFTKKIREAVCDA